MVRQGLAEGVGTGLLVLAVIGSGIAASRLSPDDTGLALLENSFATAGALLALIIALGPISGAHLNPVVTLVSRAMGSIGNREAVVYVGSQVTGAVGGAMVANLMFSLPAVSASTTVRSGGSLWLGEVVATFGLVLVIWCLVCSERSHLAAPAVAAYIGGAYFFTSSTSFANPAVTVARSLSDTFAGIAPSSVAAFVAFQLLGGAVAFAVVRIWFPPPCCSAPVARRENVRAA